MVALVFPGQGSQIVGMGKALFEVFPAARAVIQEVDDVLEEKISALMFEGPLDLLTQTCNAQPALFAAGVAALRVLEAEAGTDLMGRVRVMAGHSLGEYSALVGVGALTLAEAARLLRLRGDVMQRAVPAGEGAMAALLNLSLEQLEALPQIAGEVCVIANDNAPGQVVVSGHAGAVKMAVQWAKTQGGKGILLNVSGPFHSPLMSSAQEIMTEAIGDVVFLSPSIPVITNVSAAPQTDPKVLQVHLIQQLTGRVRWRETMGTLDQMGIASVVELGAGRVLSKLFERHMPGIQATSLETPQDIENLLQQWRDASETGNHV